MATKVDTKKQATDDSKNLGVLYTGYLEKRNPVTGSFKKRFVVLTRDSIHWFKRAEGYDLFGEERGVVALQNILTLKIMDDDNSAFEVTGTDTKKRIFRAASAVNCEEWVTAIKSATTSINTKRPALGRRSSLSGIRALNSIEEGNEENDGAEMAEVTVLLVSLHSAQHQSEIVIARNPEWNRIITITNLKRGDKLILSTSNGGTVILSYELMMTKSEDEFEFDIAIQNVTLASSLRISLLRIATDGQNGIFTAADGKKLSKSKLTRWESMVEFLINVTGDRNYAINIVLSVMVVLAALASLRAIGSENTMFFLFAVFLSLYNIHQIVERVQEKQSEKKTGVSLQLILHGHTFTSPDMPVNAPDDEIPQRFIDGCEGDLKEARRRWDITRHWRETEGTNTILQEPQPYFSLIKKMYPHYHCGKGKSGHYVYYERPGDFEGAQLAARGVTMDILLRHWLFVTEYTWQVLCKGDETAKSISVIDCNNFKMGDLAGDNLNFLKKTISIANQHYPERSYVIFIVNAPFFFSLLWKIVKPMVHENTQKKVRILSAKETLKGLQEHIDIADIPEMYGGLRDYGGRDSCRWNSEETLAMNEFVRNLNDQASGATTNRVPFGGEGTASTPTNASGSSAPVPPGNPGDDVPVYGRAPDTGDSMEDSGRHDSDAASGGAYPQRPQLTPKRPSFQRSASASTPTNRGHSDDWSVSSATTNATNMSSNPPNGRAARTSSVQTK